MKIETIIAKLEKVPEGTPLGPYTIDLGHIRADPAFQIRNQLNDANKSRLKAAYRSGKEVAPIRLAFVGDDNRPVIIDGHHRVAVLETLAAEAYRRGDNVPNEVRATFVRLSYPEARLRAAEANTEHGLNINGREARRLLARYIEAGRHRNPDGTYRSYRAIGKDLGRTHNTVSSWMKADFPGEASKMEKVTPRTGGEGAPSPVVLVKHLANDALLDLRNNFEMAGWGEREDIMVGLKSLLSEFEQVHARLDPFSQECAMHQDEDEDLPF